MAAESEPASSPRTPPDARVRPIHRRDLDRVREISKLCSRDVNRGTVELEDGPAPCRAARKKKE